MNSTEEYRREQADPADQHVALRLVSLAEFWVFQLWDGLFFTRSTVIQWNAPLAEGERGFFSGVSSAD